MKERFIYIDIFRGLCMFVVIYSHILLFSIGYPQTSLLTDFLRGFFLNSFFLSQVSFLIKKQIGISQTLKDLL